MRYLSLLGHYFIQYSKVRLAFRGDFLISLATTTAASAFGMLAVYLIFRNIPRLAGWSFHEILFLYGFSLAPMALFNLISINLWYFSGRYIIEGNFDRVLLRPLSPLFQILFEQLRLESLGDLALGLFIMWTASRHIEPAVGWAGWIFLAFAAICGAIIYVAVFLTLISMSFWMEDRVGIGPPIYNLLAFSRYPMDIYHGFLKFLLSWIVPFAFASYYPVAGALKGGSFRVHAALLPLVTAAALAVAIWVWSRGVRNYSSTGS